MTAGFLDSTFDGDGLATGIFNSGLAAVEVQGDGRIVVAGSLMFTKGVNNQWATALARYNVDGTLDTSFGVGGKRITDLNTQKNDGARDIALQPDGKLVVASEYDTGGKGGMSFSVQRYLANGTLDSSFGSGGKVFMDLGSTSDSSTEVLIRPDGKILVGGRTFTTNGLDFALVRYLPNGALDTSFGSGGKVITSLSPDNDFLHALTIQMVDVAGIPTPRIFYAGLQQWDANAGFRHDPPPGLYVVGYFVVEKAGLATQFSMSTLKSEFGLNFHVRHPSVFKTQREELVLVKGGTESRLLGKAHRISSVGTDRAGQPLKVLSPKMQKIFGSFGGKVSIQRSPPRWVDPAYVETAIQFVMNLK